jgi:predicted GNAT family acetyltransferase
MNGLTWMLVENPDTFQSSPLLFSINKNDTIICVGFQTPPWPLLLYMEEEPNESLIGFLVDRLIERNTTIPAINAKETLARRFADHWCTALDCSSSLKMKMTLFILKNVNPVPPCPGSLVQADKTHQRLLEEWAVLFHQDLSMKYESDGYVKHHVQDMIRSKNAFLWVDEHPVSMVFRERPQKQGVAIGYVFTPKEFRDHGYASNTVAEVCRRSLQEGYTYLSLFADANNPISTGIYRKIGFKDCCPYAIIDLL